MNILNSTIQNQCHKKQNIEKNINSNQNYLIAHMKVKKQNLQGIATIFVLYFYYLNP
eukprot:GDKH01026930.1.p2 GENE.GDKH01026930.1~~GDKH01026930.1.p2  ORF type:complete len:57 (-),score=1.78 GDKH01026930.1:35-205(-)